MNTSEESMFTNMYGDYRQMGTIIIPNLNLKYLTKDKQYSTHKRMGDYVWIYDDEGVLTEININQDRDLYDVIPTPYSEGA